MAGNSNNEPSDLEPSSSPSSSSIANALMLDSRLLRNLLQIPDHEYNQYSQLINRQFEAIERLRSTHHHPDRQEVQETSAVTTAAENPTGTVEKQVQETEVGAVKRRRSCDHRRQNNAFPISFSFFQFYCFTGRINQFLGAVKTRGMNRKKRSSLRQDDREIKVQETAGKQEVEENAAKLEGKRRRRRNKRMRRKNERSGLCEDDDQELKKYDRKPYFRHECSISIIGLLLLLILLDQTTLPKEDRGDFKDNC